MLVYKVVREEGGALRSALLGASEFTRRYQVGVPTYPPEHTPQAWLFAFETIEEAIAYARAIPSGKRVYLAAATEVKPAPDFVASISDWAINSFWVDGPTPGFTNSSPNGAVLCSDITLIEKVWPEE